MSDPKVAQNEDARDDSAEQAEDRQQPLADAEAVDAALEESESSTSSSPLQNELNRANERALRAQAELENFRKRVRREMDDERRYAAVPLLADLLPVIDNLERAVEAAEQSDSSGGLLEGVKMVRTQLLGVLQQHDCREIDAVGTAFDPNLHEAIGKEASEEHAPGVVTRVVRIGYQLHDRVVRPSQVLISSGPASQEAAEPDPA